MKAVRQNSLPRAASFGDLGVGGFLVVAYIVATRIGSLKAAKLGIQIGPIPLFLTEILILSLFGIIIATRSRLLIAWLLTGGTTGWPGFSLWVLLIASVIYCVAALGSWGILAVRDLAIFGYGIIYPLTYIALDTPEKAAAAMRAFAYSGLVLAILLIGDTALGLHMMFDEEVRGVEGIGSFASFGGGDVGGIIAFSAAALLAYAGVSPARRLFHLACAALCLYAVMIGQTRSAIIGLVLAMFYIFLGVKPLVRMLLLVQVAIIAAIVVAIPVLFPETSIARVIGGFWATLHSASAGAQDANAYFRLLRWGAVLDLWKSEPLFGVGFGRPVIPAALVDLSEVGQFNVGLPHNSYLTVLVRLGLFGFILVIIPWLGSVVFAFARVHRHRYGADAFAAGAAMLVMSGFAFFVLFLERPMHAASLWMLAAIVTRLLENEREQPSRAAEVTGPLDLARRIAWQKGYR